MKTTKTAKMTADEFLATLEPALDRGVGIDLIVKRIKSDVKRALAEVLPAGTKVSIRKEWATYTPHLYVQVTAWSGAVMTDDYLAFCLDPEGTAEPESGRGWTRHGGHADRARLATELADAVDLLGAIANLHNFDESDIQTDYFHVGYYLDVDASPVFRLAARAVEEERNPAAGELRAKARAAAKRLGKKVERSICGRAGVEGCGAWSLERLVELDERAAGRPMTYDKRRGRWLPSGGAPELRA